MVCAQMVAQKVGGGAAAVVALGLGIWVSGKLGRDSRVRMEALAAAQVTEAPATEKTSERSEREQAFDVRVFVSAASEDAERFGVKDFDPASLYLGQRYTLELDEPAVLKDGASWSSKHLRVTAGTDKVQFMQHGATISVAHSVARIENISAGPIAYVVRVRSHDRGRCDVRGARMHNAMALMPGETAEVVVCAGRGLIRIDRAEVLTVSELGYHYVSQLPPRAVGHDGVTASAHTPVQRVPPCRAVDTKGIADYIRQGTARWVDVVDYYARHSCERYGYFPGYRYEDGPRDRLPQTPRARAGR